MIGLLLSRGLGALGFQILNVWMSFRIYKITGSFATVGLFGLGIFVANAASLYLSATFAEHLFERSRRALFTLQFGIAVLAFMIFYFLGDSPRLLIGAGMLSSFLRQSRSLLYLKTLSIHVENGESSAWVAKWNSFSWQTALFLGPLLFSLFNFAPVLSLICLLGSAALVFSEHAANRNRPDERPILKPSLAAAWKDFRLSPAAFVPWIMDSLVTLMVNATSLLPFILSRSGNNPINVGSLRSAMALGALATSFLIPMHWVAKHGRTLFGISLLGVGLATSLYTLHTTLTGFILIAIAVGAIDGLSVIIRDEVLLSAVPRTRIAPIGAITTLMISVSDDLGDFRAGIFSEYLGLNATLWIGSIVSIGAGVYYFLKISSKKSFIAVQERSSALF